MAATPTRPRVTRRPRATPRSFAPRRIPARRPKRLATRLRKKTTSPTGTLLETSFTQAPIRAKQSEAASISPGPRQERPDDRLVVEGPVIAEDHPAQVERAVHPRVVAGGGDAHLVGHGGGSEGDGGAGL